jgi:hypothetical protein
MLTASSSLFTVLDPEKRVCTDPRGRDATLGAGGPVAPMGDNEQ